MNLASCFRGSSSSSNQLSVESARRGRHQRRRAISSPDSGKTLALTPEDIKWIQRTWYGHQDSQDLTVRIFLQVFRTKPDLAALFGLDPKEFSKSEDGETAKKYLRSDCRFLEHAKAFASFFEHIIHELSDGSAGSNSEDLISMIRAMGTHHSTIPNLSFTAENFLLIKTKILETVCRQEFVPERNKPLDKPCTAWCKLLMFMIAEMKDAYILGVTRKNTWPGGSLGFCGEGSHILSLPACSFLSTSDEISSSASSSGFCSNASSEEKLTISDHHRITSGISTASTSPSQPQLYSGDHRLQFGTDLGSPNKSARDDHGLSPKSAASRCPFHLKQSSENGQASLMKPESDEIRRPSDSNLTLIVISSSDNDKNINCNIGIQSLKISTC